MISPSGIPHKSFKNMDKLWTNVALFDETNYAELSKKIGIA